MKYIKFERVTEEDNPIVRITYKTWYGKEVTRDAFLPSPFSLFWRWLDNNEFVSHTAPIEKFVKTGLKEYTIK